MLVDGSCVAWILRGHNEPLRSLTLSDDRERRLASALKLAEWNTINPSQFGGCADAPGITYRFGQQRISGPTCGLPAGDPLRELNAAFDAQVGELVLAATETAGDMRYLVWRSAGSGGAIDNRVPVAWPLDVSLESIAGQGFQYLRGSSSRATGLDASRLRAIRTTTANGSAGGGTFFDFTPIAGAGGAVFQLFTRDAVPFEDDDGLLPADLF